MSSYSEAIKEAFATARTDLAIVDTIEIYHPSIAERIYLVRDFNDQTFTLETGQDQLFTAGGFTVQLPSKTDKGIQNLNIAIDNTDRRASNFSKESLKYPNESIQVIYRPYLSNDFSQPQMNPPLVLFLSNIDIKVLTVSATASFADIINKPFPSNLYTPARFPAL